MKILLVQKVPISSPVLTKYQGAESCYANSQILLHSFQGKGRYGEVGPGLSPGYDSRTQNLAWK